MAAKSFEWTHHNRSDHLRDFVHCGDLPNQGIGNAHFGWKQETLDSIRKTLFRFGIVYIPAGLIACSTLYGETSSYGDSIGRISMMSAKLWICFLLWQQFGGKNGLVAVLEETQPHRLLTRTRLLCTRYCSPLFFSSCSSRLRDRIDQPESQLR